MQNMFKNVHSKRFLLTYLGLVVFLLLLFLTLNQQQPVDIPKTDRSMVTVFDPTVEVPQFLAYSTDNTVFTNDALTGKWSFVFIPSADCLDCDAVFRVLRNLKDGLADRSVQLVVSTTDLQSDKLLGLSQLQNLDARIITPSGSLKEQEEWTAFFTTSSSFSYQDLNHTVFLINPKAMLVAGFQAPFTSVFIRQSFIQLRSQYALKH
ncbi:hypothetical protein [Methylophaga nitratireducenticrescens]|uniref:Uncharacterized protein n=1 Tax=Methylophaga nitratireducenticrescens TaxID=754476 RepID=I1XFK0_METNJ|nr:hypothetical protein [Methylophaga nitratireducenticrescens]AFI83169.1 hypothetical protein Q7A_311 [Methylophaga nitratireducenticrescens]AUZ83308.1 hypothetical protein CDW43_01360 [Methylophaga nitratireducenticrescens]